MWYAPGIVSSTSGAPCPRFYRAVNKTRDACICRRGDEDVPPTLRGGRESHAHMPVRYTTLLHYSTVRVSRGLSTTVARPTHVEAREGSRPGCLCCGLAFCASRNRMCGVLLRSVGGCNVSNGRPRQQRTTPTSINGCSRSESTLQRLQKTADGLLFVLGVWLIANVYLRGGVAGGSRIHCRRLKTRTSMRSDIWRRKQARRVYLPLVLACWTIECGRGHWLYS